LTGCAPCSEFVWPPKSLNLWSFISKDNKERITNLLYGFLKTQMENNDKYKKWFNKPVLPKFHGTFKKKAIGDMKSTLKPGTNRNVRRTDLTPAMKLKENL